MPTPVTDSRASRPQFFEWSPLVRKVIGLSPGRYAPLAITTALLATVSIRAVLQRTEGSPAVPLDDTFIHFQFARTFAELRPFEYSLGAAPTPGATSLLWPLILAPFYALGFRELSLIWVAWAFNYVSLGLLALETRRLAQHLVSEMCSLGAGAMVLAFGGYLWCAGSGMEVLPFAWLLVRSARTAAHWAETPTPATRGELMEACALGLIPPLLRPEGIIASGLMGLVLLSRGQRAPRWWGLIPGLGPALPGLVNLVFTGQWATTTMEVKWLPYSPYPSYALSVFRYNLNVFAETLLNGQIWSALFIPQGSKLVAWAALPALWIQGLRVKKFWRTAAVTLVALGMLIPATYESFLVNRLRYLWPFAAGWFVGLAALAELTGAAFALLNPRWRAARILVAGGFVGAFASHLSYTVEDVATSASAIHQQQVSLGLWARDELPADALIGINDAGAITYLSGRRTFDVVGLTTLGEGRYWTAGAGSRFEHYERLGASRLPTHLILYENWFAVDAVLGEVLTERSVAGATILGDTTKTAFRARWDALGSGRLPRSVDPSATPSDEVDVADLESEYRHNYQVFWATQRENVVVSDAHGRVDGARQNRSLDRFTLSLHPGARVVARLASAGPTELEIRIAGQRTGTLELSGLYGWEEPEVVLPNSISPGQATVEVIATNGQTFTALHYWVFR